MAGDRPISAARNKASGKHLVKPKTCRNCGCTFLAATDNDRVFCTDACKEAWRDRRRFASRARPAVTTIHKPCAECGSRFHTIYPFAIACSDECREARARRAAITPKSEATCLCCGSAFLARQGTKYCSSLCARRAARERARASGSKAMYRKARKLRERVQEVEAVNPLLVFERDRWTCKLCGRKTPKRLRGYS